MSSTLFDAEAAFSSRRSVSRARSQITLQDHGGVMLLAELAAACGMTTTRLKHVLLGNGADFSVDRAPFTLGHVVIYETPVGQMVALTPAGEEECARLRREPFWALGRGRGVYG